MVRCCLQVLFGCKNDSGHFYGAVSNRPLNKNADVKTSNISSPSTLAYTHHMHTHIQAHTHVHSYTHTQARIHTHTHSLSLSLTHTHTQAHRMNNGGGGQILMQFLKGKQGMYTRKHARSHTHTHTHTHTHISGQ